MKPFPCKNCKAPMNIEESASATKTAGCEIVEMLSIVVIKCRCCGSMQTAIRQKQASLSMKIPKGDDINEE